MYNRDIKEKLHVAIFMQNPSLNIEGGKMIQCKKTNFKQLYFENEKDEDIFLKYLIFKGTYLHKQIYDILLQYDQKCYYSELSNIVIYDKGLRNQLFKFLSAAEEKLRSVLFDNYDIQHKIDNPDTFVVKQKELIKKVNYDNSNLYFASYSKNFTFGKLQEVMKGFDLLSNYDLSDIENVKILRNKVMHHNLITISFHIHKDDVENELKKLELLIESLYRILPHQMKGAFQYSINKCNNVSNMDRKPNLNKLCLGVMINGIFE